MKTMNLIKIAAMAAAVLCLGVSCKKDKTPEPEKKLVKLVNKEYNGEDLKSSYDNIFRYDEKGRLTEWTMSSEGSSTSTISYTYSNSSISRPFGGDTRTYSLEDGKITTMSEADYTYKFVYDSGNRLKNCTFSCEDDDTVKDSFNLTWKDGNIDRFDIPYYGEPSGVEQHKFEYSNVAVRGIDVNLFTVEMFILFGIDPFLVNAGYFGKTRSAKLIKSWTFKTLNSTANPVTIEYTYTFDKDNYVSSVEYTIGTARRELLFEWEEK